MGKKRGGDPIMTDRNEPVKMNSVNWWSDDAVTSRQMQPDIPQGIVSEDIEPIAPAVVNQPIASSQPVQSASGPQQVAPVIQPLVIVPYVSKDQPIHYIDGAYAENAYDGYDEDDYDDEYCYEDMYDTKKISKAKRNDTYYENNASSNDMNYSVGLTASTNGNGKKKKCKANGGAIAAFIFGVLYILMLFDWTWVISFDSFTFDYNTVFHFGTGYELIREFIDKIIDGSFVFGMNTDIVMLLLSVGAVLVALSTIFALCTVATKTPILFKIIAVLGFLAQVASYVLAAYFISPKVQLGDHEFGFYILAGLALIVMVCLLAARKGRKK